MDMSTSIIRSRHLLENPYAYLDGHGCFSALRQLPKAISNSKKKYENPYAHIELQEEPEVDDSVQYIHSRASNLTTDKSPRQKRRGHYSHNEIEKIVKRLQNEMWTNKSHIWPKNTPRKPLEILNPIDALNYIGYECKIEVTLGQYKDGDKLIEVAGFIDDKLKEVCISEQFAHNIQNFTAAHELGHALLHEGQGRHRDRPIDGSYLSLRSNMEIEADKFATYFLMPSKTLCSEFEKYFLCQTFALSTESIYALGQYADAAAKCNGIRDLSRLLANAKSYNGQHYQKSLAELFNVSVGAMAIRLEELNLVA
jgi:IrrE N-terminal-like domain